MADYEQLLYDIEVHSPEGIERYFKKGGDPNDVVEGAPVFTSMVEMYARTPRFKDCINVFISYGLKFSDDALLAVLADDAIKLEKMINSQPGILTRTYSMFNNTFTPLTGGTLLHFCAEYNSVACAEVLLKHDADINARAAIDEFGFGGHTPIFHTVNQNNNNSIDVLQLLLEYSADLQITVRGLIWGKGYEWETFIPAINPVSYAVMGLLPQMHRDEKTVAATISLLMKHAYSIDYQPKNVPNVYLQ